MKKALIISFSDLKKDPRPYRQISELKKNFQIFTIGTEKSELEDVFFRYKKRSTETEAIRTILLKLGLDKFYFWDNSIIRIADQLKNHSFDLIVINEIRAVPIIDKLKRTTTKVVLDAHEYSPENFEDDWLWKFLYKKYYLRLCNLYIKSFDLITTVSDGISGLYSTNFGVKAKVIRGFCDYHSGLYPKPVSGKIKILHHGLVSSSRSLHLLIELAKSLGENYNVYLMLVYRKSTEKIYKGLMSQAKELTNVIFLPPQKRENLIDFCNSFDIGVIFFPPVNLNLKFALPNKFFEMIQSRLMIATGPDEEMSPLVDKYSLGIISENWDINNLAFKIKKLSEKDIFKYKMKTDVVAKELSSEVEMKKFSKLIDDLFQDSLS
jgi:glycosyltransferase involved in cell wall biosynthesis